MLFKWKEYWDEISLGTILRMKGTIQDLMRVHEDDMRSWGQYWG